MEDAQTHIGPGDLRVESAAYAADRERDGDCVEDRRLLHQMIIVVRLPLHLGGQHVVEILAGAADHLRRVDLRAAHRGDRSEEHTSELQSLMRISYAVFCLKKKTQRQQ